jgi:hypothetical protein
MEVDSETIELGEIFIVCRWSGTSSSWDNTYNGLVAGLSNTADVGNGNILYGESGNSDFGSLSLFNGDFYLNGEKLSSSQTGRTVLPSLSNSSGAIINARVLASFGSANIDGFGLGFKGFDRGYFHWIGDYAEIICYDELLSDEDRVKVEGYLAYKWGLQSSLPATGYTGNTWDGTSTDEHPYKNVRPSN